MKIQQDIYQQLFSLAVKKGYFEESKLLAIDRPGLELSRLAESILKCEDSLRNGALGTSTAQLYRASPWGEIEPSIEEKKELIRWLREHEENPFELKHLCRLAVRKYLQTPLRVKLMALALPHCIMDFLMYNTSNVY